MLKKCPNCNELVGENVRECFNCHYDFILKRTKTNQDIEDERKTRQEEELKKKINDKKKIESLEAVSDTIRKNALYEYKTEYIKDFETGEPNTDLIDRTLIKYAEAGWKLHTIVVNEIGKVASTAGFGGMSAGTNATINVTIMVFERCIKAADYR